MRIATFLDLGTMAIIAGCSGRSPGEPFLSGSADFTVVYAPSSVTATAVSATEVDLAWPTATKQVNGYQLFRSTTGRTGAFTAITTVGASVTRYADASLRASAQYCYKVRSYLVVNRTTTYSDFSMIACATTFAPPPPALAAPSAVTAVPTRDDPGIDASSGLVVLAWADNSTNEDGFRVEQASTTAGPWSLIATTAAGTMSLGWRFPRETQACVRVAAYNANGTSNASAPACTTPPANATKLAATIGADQGAVQLTWNDVSAVEDGYKVSRRDLRSAQWMDIATLPPNSTSYSDHTAVADVVYVYRVLAMKDGGFSDDSNLPAAVIATSPPLAPNYFTITFGSDVMYGWVYFDAYWTDPTPDDAGYDFPNTYPNTAGFRLQTSADGVTGWTSGTVVDVSFWQFSYNPWGQPGVPGHYQDKIDLFAAIAAGEVAGGCYRVVAFNSRGDSPPSAVRCGEWGGAATNVAATPVDKQSIDLSWTDNARFENSYLVLRSTEQNGTYDFIAELPANSRSYQDTGLTSGTTYWYLIVNNSDSPPNDNSNYSDYAAATTYPTPATATSARIRIKGRATPIRVRGLPVKNSRQATLFRSPS
jgi:hypothetical protein